MDICCTTYYVIVSQTQTHPSTPCFVMLELGLYKPHFLFVSASWREAIRQEKGQGTSSFLSASCGLQVYFCSCEHLPSNTSPLWQQQLYSFCRFSHLHRISLTMSPQRPLPVPPPQRSFSSVRPPQTSKY